MSVGDELPYNSVYLWSDGNPRLPDATMSTSGEAIADREGVWSENVGGNRHVVLNDDMELAIKAVNHMLGITLEPDSESDPPQGSE